MISSFFENIRSVLVSEISKAENEILVAVYWFTNYELFNLLLKKLDSGVSVKLIIHNDFINNRESGLPFQSFVDAGGKFYFSDLRSPMHNKFCTIDGKVLINGSYNWTYFAEKKNRENILVIKEEPAVINSFIKEFEKLIDSTYPIKSIDNISVFEIGINDEFNHQEYLAQDLLYKASLENNRELINTAFELVPDNINIQKLALELDLLDHKYLKYNIGVSLLNDELKLIAKKGDRIPSSFTTIVRTSIDNQTKSITDIVYGYSLKASENKKLINFEFDEIPPLPKGKAEIKFTFSIDKDGLAIIEQLSLSNGEKLEKSIREVDLLESTQGLQSTGVI